MIWPFSKKSKADAVIGAMDEAISLAASKSRQLSSLLVYRDGVPTAERIRLQVPPIAEELRSKYAALADAPDSIVLMLIAKGIEQAEFYSREQIEEAFGAPLPD